MTNIFIEGVLSRNDLRQATSAVLAAMEELAPTMICREVRCRRKDGSNYSCEVLIGPSAGPRLVLCPARGTHTRLTDCWACWADVVRGAAMEAEVLVGGAWDEIVRGLGTGTTLMVEDGDEQ